MSEITVGATSGRPLIVGLHCKPLRKFLTITLLQILIYQISQIIIDIAFFLL